jgi:hypothetical protein
VTVDAPAFVEARHTAHASVARNNRVAVEFAGVTHTKLTAQSRVRVEIREEK